eukprot:CAMPEP_0177478376 /NCGR_PEP_ID=MMETSP0369-20130122/24653_1 /TAXON_ID=447022 ORGANISM="Scrippsiella hangoei-like, Strain SHHI-4" /NCGR_SAMPLE_ID=MMETSP0369 /ASSEMBLY_ACC=CAM_ASM_000364 /LENGTH=102 /DNA_ID=CAMNT_0018953801 /DNA_START=214 /DNA_END=518 /DNA_ORIENTATION=-
MGGTKPLPAPLPNEGGTIGGADANFGAGGRTNVLAPSSDKSVAGAGGAASAWTMGGLIPGGEPPPFPPQSPPPPPTAPPDQAPVAAPSPPPLQPSPPLPLQP